MYIQIYSFSCGCLVEVFISFGILKLTKQQKGYNDRKSQTQKPPSLCLALLLTVVLVVRLATAAACRNLYA